MNPAKVTLAIGFLAMGTCATTTQPIPARAVFLAQISYIAQPDEAAKGFHYVPQPADALNGGLPPPRNVRPAKELIASPRV